MKRNMARKKLPEMQGASGVMSIFSFPFRGFPPDLEKDWGREIPGLCILLGNNLNWVNNLKKSFQ